MSDILYDATRAIDSAADLARGAVAWLGAVYDSHTRALLDRAETRGRKVER